MTFLSSQGAGFRICQMFAAGTDTIIPLDAGYVFQNSC